MNKNQRNRIRKRRLNLSDSEYKQAANALFKNVSNQSLFLNSQRIAAYLPVDGEIDPRPLMQLAWQLGKQVYLPVLVPHQSNLLWFARWTPNTPMVKNIFGIEEPRRVHQQRIKAQALDLVLTPLVGFDLKGNRLGMGGGYYDHTFEFLRRRDNWRKPYLLGIGYEFQKTPTLTTQPWDIPMDAVATNTHWRKF